MKSTTMIPSIGTASTPTLRSALRSAGALGSLASLRIGAKIYAGFCLVLFLLVLISGASWLGLQQTTSGMETSQQSSDAAITTAVMDGQTSGALYFAQKFMAAGREEDASAVREQLAGVREARSEEHTSELQSLMRKSYAVFCLKQ